MRLLFLRKSVGREGVDFSGVGVGLSFLQFVFLSFGRGVASPS